MAANEMKRFKQLLPKISARLLNKTDRIVEKMKKLGIIKNDVKPHQNIFEIIAESNNSEILEYVKEALKMEGLEPIVLQIEGKQALTGDYTDNSSSSADEASDIFRNDSQDKSESICDELRKMRQELQDIKLEIKESRAEAREQNEKLLESIIKLETEKDEMKKAMEEIDATGIDKAAYETLQKKFHELESKHNRLREQMNKMGKTELALRERNQRLETEIAQVKLALIHMQSTKEAKGKMYAKFTKKR